MWLRDLMTIAGKRGLSLNMRFGRNPMLRTESNSSPIRMGFSSLLTEGALVEIQHTGTATQTNLSSSF